MAKEHEAILTFQDQIKELSDAADIQEFTKVVLRKAPASYWMDKDAVEHTKKVFLIVQGMMEADQVKSPIKEVVLAGVLLSDICINEDEDKETHNLQAICKLNKFKNDIHPNYYVAIINIINAHEGEIQIRGTEPKPGGPEHLVAMANSIARISGVTINA